jgi:F-type H+-transporting ATPase subunit gamma
MANFRQYDKKISGLRSMQRVTKTMKMVAATKLQRAQQAQKTAGVYNAQLGRLVERLAAAAPASHPLLTTRSPARNALLLVITSDKGLCGGFNNRLIRGVEQWLADHRESFHRVRVSFCGKRGYEALRRQVEVRSFYDEVAAKPGFADASAIGAELRKVFLAGRYDEVYLAYNQFKSALTQIPTIDRLLPLVPARAPAAAHAMVADYLFEPTGPELLGLLLEKTVNFRVFHALLENAAGEHGARMTAMDSATNNIETLTDRYTLLKNQARQAAITTELVEIISGAEALK